VSQCSQSTTLTVFESQSVSRETSLQDTVLFTEERDYVGLLTMEPTAQGREQQLKREHTRSLRHAADPSVGHYALRLGGYPRLVTTIRNAPEVGQLVLAGGQPYAIRYARERVEGGGRTIVVVTVRPVFFLGGGRETSKPRAGYEVAIVQIQLDAKGQAKGTIATAARVRPDGDGGVLLDDYNEQLITLTNITRKAL
jgi:hypothetical protein